MGNTQNNSRRQSVLKFLAMNFTFSEPMGKFNVPKYNFFDCDPNLLENTDYLREKREAKKK